MHAYGLIKAREIVLEGGQRVRLVRVRNPWGYGEWTGTWSDECDLRFK